MPKWSDLGNIVNTLRELDVSVIREESEQPLSLVCIGHPEALQAVSSMLHRPAFPLRYPPPGPTPLVGAPLGDPAMPVETMRRAQLLIFAIDGRRQLSASEAEGFDRLEQLAVPAIVVLAYAAGLPDAVPLSPAVRARLVAIPDPAAADAADRLAAAVFERLPAECHLAAARRLPGLRGAYSRDLIAATSLTNATYALASGLPEQIPILSIPFAAADILVLTKNQAILVYRLALAYGAPPDFQARIREVIPVIGGAFLWRQAARSLIGMIPIWGLVPKVAIAYAGTYTTGMAAWRWFEQGEAVTREQLKRISADAQVIGRTRAAELIERARNAGEHLAAQARSTRVRLTDQARELGAQAGASARSAGEQLARMRRNLPFRRK